MTMATTEYSIDKKSSMLLLDDDNNNDANNNSSKQQQVTSNVKKKYRKRRVIDESTLSANDVKRLDARRLQNRESAARARKRNKQNVKEMEKMILSLKNETILLRDENTNLKVQSMTLAKENSELRCEIAIMKHHHNQHNNNNHMNQNRSSVFSARPSSFQQQGVVRRPTTLNNTVEKLRHQKQNQAAITHPTIAGEGFLMNNSKAVILPVHNAALTVPYPQPASTVANNPVGSIMTDSITYPSLSL